MGEAIVQQRVLDDGTVLIDLRGELDIAVDNALGTILVDVVGRRPPRIVIDMRHVSFVDSTGIGALIAGYQAAYAAEVGYAVRRPAPFVERQLRLTGLYDTLVARHDQ